MIGETTRSSDEADQMVHRPIEKKSKSKWGWCIEEGRSWGGGRAYPRFSGEGREKELLRRLERASDVVGGGEDIIKLNAKLLM